jgi:hypothetical protein
LDQLFLKEKHWQLILNKLMGYKMNKIKQFQKSLLTKVKLIKQEKRENLLKYKKGNDFNVTFFLREIMSEFILNAEKKENEKTLELNKLKGMSLKAQADGEDRPRGKSLYQYLKIDEVDEEEDDAESQSIEIKLRQKEILKQQLKANIKKINK